VGACDECELIQVIVAEAAVEAMALPWTCHQWYGARFLTRISTQDTIGSHACSLEASMRVTNSFPVGWTLPLTVAAVNHVATLKVLEDELEIQEFSTEREQQRSAPQKIIDAGQHAQPPMLHHHHGSYGDHSTNGVGRDSGFLQRPLPPRTVLFPPYPPRLLSNHFNHPACRIVLTFGEVAAAILHLEKVEEGAAAVLHLEKVGEGAAAVLHLENVEEGAAAVLHLEKVEEGAAAVLHLDSTIAMNLQAACVSSISCLSHATSLNQMLP
jgi:hypothetical protein